VQQKLSKSDDNRLRDMYPHPYTNNTNVGNNANYGSYITYHFTMYKRSQGSSNLKKYIYIKFDI